jgi:hypothetical protein
MTEDDKDPPEPPPVIRTVTATSPMTDEEIDDQIFQREVDEDRQLELFDAEEQSKKFHALFVNRAFVKAEGRHMRITFGESVGGENIYHNSIVMTVEDAYELGKLLTDQSALAFAPLLDHDRSLIRSLDKDAGPQDPR